MATVYVERVVSLDKEEKEILEKATEILKQIYDGFSSEYSDDNISLRYYENSEVITKLLNVADCLSVD